MGVGGSVGGLSQNLVDDLSVYIRKAEIAAGVAVGELFVVDAKDMKKRGMQVVDGDALVDGAEAELVGGAVAGSPLEAAAGHEHGEAVWVMVAAVAAFGDGGAAELAAPDDCGLVEEARGA